MQVILITVLVLGAIGVVGAALLYVVAKKFHTHEDPRIGEVESLLPGANCGACGRSGCHDFATACVAADSLESLACPGAGDAAMKRIAALLGLEASVAKPQIAVVKCGGSCEMRPRKVRYDGIRLCSAENAVGAGESMCGYGCLGCGDCVSACRFDAIHIDEATGLPVVDESKCTGCSACADACPRKVITIRSKGPRGIRVWVACSSRDKGAYTMKVCKAGCIGCRKCAGVCSHDAITVNGNLAVIDPEKCKLCRKCEAVCPTGAIRTSNFPVRKSDCSV